MTYQCRSDRLTERQTPQYFQHLQPHRLEFNGCERLYNGTSFRLGMRIKKLEDIF